MTVEVATEELEPTRMRDPAIGAEVSGYRITSRLGEGGMGIVYEGEQPIIGKKVAIKVLKAQAAEDPELVKRLVAEARAVNQIGHRGIIDVFGFGQLPDGRQCIVMEFLEGAPFDQVLWERSQSGERMPLSDTLIILDEVFSALGAAHSAGVVHRDLKPSNVFLVQQRDGTSFVKLLDFGIAKLGVLGGGDAARASVVIGTPEYMAPEQANAGDVGPAMDLYAMGVMAFEMLTGRLPFVSKSLVELLISHASEPAPRVREFAPDVPAELDELVAKLLAKRPEDRPASAEVTRQELARIRREHIGKVAEFTVRLEQPVSRARAALENVATSNDTGQSPPPTVRRPDRVAPPPAAPETTPDTARTPPPAHMRPSEQFVVPRNNGRNAIVAACVVVSFAGALWVLLRTNEPAHVAQPTPAVENVKEAALATPVAESVRDARAPDPVAVAPPQPTAPLASPAPGLTPTPAPTPAKNEPTPATVAAAKKVATKGATEGVDPLRARIKALLQRLEAAEQRGENVAMLKSSITKVSSKLASHTDRDALESAVTRLEEEVSSLEGN